MIIAKRVLYCMFDTAMMSKAVRVCRKDEGKRKDEKRKREEKIIEGHLWVCSPGPRKHHFFDA